MGDYPCYECGQTFDSWRARAGHAKLHPVPLKQRFLEKITRDPDTGCWLWQAATKESGYGVIRDPGRDGRLRRAHRVAWEIYRDEIPDGSLVLHDCGRKACVNPDHLHLGDHSQNLEEAWERGEQTVGDHHESFGERTRRMNAALSDEEAMEVRRRYSGGATHGELSEAFGVSHTTINGIVTGRTYQHLPTDCLPDREERQSRKGQRGERHVRAKVSADEVREIRRKYASGRHTHRDLADQYGISKKSVWQIIHRESWTHID